jgi:hypothetical protein
LRRGARRAAAAAAAAAAAKISSWTFSALSELKLRRGARRRRRAGGSGACAGRWMQMVVHQLVGNDLIVQDVELKLNETSNGMDHSD